MMTSHDRVRIAAAALVCERTVIRVYKGGGTAYSRLRVAEGAKALGLPLPPEPSTGSSPPSPEPSQASSKAA
jgi:hypothetical protein